LTVQLLKDSDAVRIAFGKGLKELLALLESRVGRQPDDVGIGLDVNDDWPPGGKGALAHRDNILRPLMRKR
jgi:hypothetical protein